MRIATRYWIIERQVTPGYKKRVSGIEIEGYFWEKDTDSISIRTDEVLKNPCFRDSGVCGGGSKW